MKNILTKVHSPYTWLRNQPSFHIPIETEALFGQDFYVEETKKNALGEKWSRGHLIDDGYKGWILRRDLEVATKIPEATHKVKVLWSFIYSTPSIKQPILGFLSLNSQIALKGTEGKFTSFIGKNQKTCYLLSQDLAPVQEKEQDFVTVAETFLNVPYLWGGKRGLGVDCSGLIQLALNRIGLLAKRNTYEMEETLGEKIYGSASGPSPSPEPSHDPSHEPLSLPPLKRGDLVFWKGHMGVMRNDTDFLHANAHHMRVVSEPLTLVCQRSKNPITSIRRI